jgi:hypothetical protein
LEIGRFGFLGHSQVLWWEFSPPNMTAGKRMSRMSDNTHKTKATRRRNRRSLDEQYEEIGIRAVAAAVRFGTDNDAGKKPSEPHNKEHPNRTRRMRSDK